MIELKPNASEKSKELLRKLASVPNWYDDFLLGILIYTRNNDENVQEVIDFIDAQDELSISLVTEYVIRRDYEKWERD